MFCILCVLGGLGVRIPPHSRTVSRLACRLLATLRIPPNCGVRRQSAAATALWISSERRWERRFNARHVHRIQSGVALRFPPHSKTLRVHEGPGCKRCNSGTCDVLECAGRAQRRRRFGSSPDDRVNADLLRATSAESKAAWRFASRRTPKCWHAHQRPVANAAFPAGATSWTAPAERGGDGALDRFPTAVATSTSYVPRLQHPKRRGASLPCKRSATPLLLAVPAIGPKPKRRRRSALPVHPPQLDC
jgi:hypothetical protein